MKLHNKKVLVLGATGGIGAAVTRELVNQGARLVLVARSEFKIEQMLRELDAGQEAVEASYFIDFMEKDSIDTLYEVARDHGDIDIIIHALGVNSFESYRHMDTDRLQAMFDVNLFSLMHVSRVLVPNLVQRDNGKLLVIGSTFGSIGFPGFSMYSASKFALRGYVESLRRELADTTLDILYIAPRATNTELNDARIVAMNQALGNAVDAPQKVARQVMRALRKNASTSYIGWPEKLFVFINSLNSRLVDKGIAKQLPIISRLLAE